MYRGVTNKPIDNVNFDLLVFRNYDGGRMYWFYRRRIRVKVHIRRIMPFRVQYSHQTKVHSKYTEHAKTQQSYYKNSKNNTMLI